MKKSFQKISLFFLSLLIASSSLFQPLSVRATSPGDPFSLSVICTASNAWNTFFASVGFDWLTLDPDGPWYNPSLCSFHNKVFGTIGAPVADDQLFGERYTYAQINWITYSLLIQTLGRLENFTPVHVLQMFTENYTPTFQDFATFGPAGFMMGSISEMVSHPPASGIDAVQSTLAKFDLAGPAHAQQQGFGYRSTSFLQPLWAASRNMAYAIMVILLIASGFLVMFRVKVNPQTAVSLQLMIPRIIITLLAVTFSYAIAGFIIDLLYVVLTVFISLLISNGLSDNRGETLQFFTTPGFEKLFLYYTNAWNTIGWRMVIPIIGPLLGFIISLVVLFLLFRVWWMMLKTYLTLMFLIIIGPWQIMLGILPGQQGFGSWLRNIIANVSVFAVVPIMFIFNLIFWNHNTFISSLIGTVFGGQGFVDLFSVMPHIVSPPGGGLLPNFPLFAESGLFFNFALGYAILALIPKTADMIRDALKSSKFGYGSAFGEALGPARTVGSTVGNLGLGGFSGWTRGMVGDNAYTGITDPTMPTSKKVLYGVGWGIDQLRRKG